MEASESPSAKWLWKEKSTAAVLVFLGSTRVGCVNARRKPPWEDGVGSGDKGGEDGPGPPIIQFLLSLSIPGTRGSAILSFVWRLMGVRRKGSPTRIDYFCLGQDRSCKKVAVASKQR